MQIKETVLKGVPISSGVSMGVLFYLRANEDVVKECAITLGSVESEIERYRIAIASVKKEIQSLQMQCLSDKTGDSFYCGHGQRLDLLEKDDAFQQISQRRMGASGNAGVDQILALLEGHLQILEDPTITLEVVFQIRQEKKNAAYLFHKAMDKCQKELRANGNAFFRERIRDLKDVQRRVLCALKETPVVAISIPEHAILFAAEFSIADVAEAHARDVRGFISQHGSKTSHASILLRAKKIPSISSINCAAIKYAEGHFVILNGEDGEVVIDPSKATKAKYAEACKKKSFFTPSKKEPFASLSTNDGHHVNLFANMDSMQELSDFHLHNISGVGLFRTEFLFLDSNVFPSEDEQFAVYKEIVERMNGLPIVMRTFDIGGDKPLLGQKNLEEYNPFLGCRAIRFMLQEKNLFKTQLKAILRAAAYGNVRIMLPMISSLTELLEAKKALRKAQEEIGCQGRDLPLGCMIEVPSAAVIADLLAKECRFLSIGTNDLVQYALAVDRGNTFLSSLYTPSHPSILRLIKFVVKEASHSGIPVSICGEMAADPRFTPLLLGLGVQDFSVALRNIHAVKECIRQCSIVEAIQLAKQALQLSTTEEIDKLLSDFACK